MTRAFGAVLFTLAATGWLTFGVSAAPQISTPAIHARSSKPLVVSPAMVLYGSAKPPFGPVDITIDNGLITSIAGSAEGGSAPRADADVTTIDATGKYDMPGIVNAHMHWHEERQPGIAQPIQYERNLYLAAGVTTARDVGSDFDKSKRWQAESNAHAIVAPRILVYPFVNKSRSGSPAEIRAWSRDI